MTQIMSVHSRSTAVFIFTAGVSTGIAVCSMFLSWLHARQRDAGLAALRADIAELRKLLLERRTTKNNFVLDNTQEDLEEASSSNDDLYFLEARESLSRSTSQVRFSETLDDDVDYGRIDALLDSPQIENRLKAYDSLTSLSSQGSSGNNKSSHYYWRCARAAYLSGQACTNDEEKRKRLYFEARDHAFRALQQPGGDEDANVQKWCALTLGVIGDYVSVTEKIQNGYKFKEHIDAALRLQPNDYMLHYLHGRWCFGVASLSWVERKVAATLFAEPPTATFETALEEHMLVERMLKRQWKDNKLCVARCLIAQAQYAEGAKWLRDGHSLSTTTPDDVEAQKEIEQLLVKYGNY